MSKGAIICIDDERVVLVSLRDQLNNHLLSEFDIELAENGEEALEILAELQADDIEIPLIICDQIMPGIKGDELLIKIHSLYPKTLKIMLTGQASTEAVGNALNHANLYRYIGKPWDETDLCLTVTEAIRSYFQDKELIYKNQTLQKIRTELEELNASLEQKVVERTTELAKANAQLQQEINERNLLEQKLSTSERQIRTIFEAMSEIVLIVNDREEITAVPTNPGRFYKFETDLVNLTIEQFFQDKNNTWFGKVRQALDSQETINFDYSLSVGEREIWFAASISPLPNNSVTWVARDISDRKQAEAAWEKAKEAALRANQAKSEFLSKMSHELRTPLNAILGFTQLLARDNSLNQVQREQLGIVERSGEHLLQLINDVLEMSKIEAGRIAFNENNFDLISTLNSIKEMLQLKAESKRLQLIFDCAPHTPQYLRTDENKLRQVLINLIGNAIKFTSSGGVVLRVMPGNDLAEIVSENATKSRKLLFEVEDTGPGIAPHELDTLFDPFVQTETGRNSEQGTGLGLPISRQFVQLMGGDITVNSVLGEGTIFKFDVKVELVEAKEVQTYQSSKRAIALAPNQPKYRILAVDDRWESRQLLIHLLSPLGFDVRAAENGQQAIEEWQSWEPNLILMDMQMPVMDGYEATKYIKAHLKGQATVIIALTASVFEENRITVLSAGCDDFVRKPFREEVLLEKLATYLGVRYVYSEAQSTTSTQSRESQKQLEPESLTVMPSGWITQLYEAADSIDNDRILELIAEIPAEEAFLAQYLTDLVKKFRCDAIIDLIERINR
ncbi:response regulator [Planktothrix sp. FACHB-1355]|uniref:Circadian input-output histidine kinase CikA n=1 Tax=Aerosakkonema funiforme FACHB-1375 TaxID=2949571 RepID=A0A926VBY4_9CYAN|nr:MULTISPECIES: response regulator [Oscillatoriales]MBD2179759.1 response regulator [Aerosakkonema funiforme FACHB-1375]MBD3558480.1 response regulator [Planktothrix sp. FACHB-1355]